MTRFIFTVSLIYELFFLIQVHNKTFSRCELVRELTELGFPRHQLKDWICLIEGESSRRTDVIGGPDSDGSFDHGLFQINDRYWCSHRRPGKGCNVKCNDLRTDDISVAAKCAKEIFKQQGFSAWVAWKNECQGNLPNLDQCLLELINR